MKEFENIELTLETELQLIAAKNITAIEKAEQSIQACSNCLKRFKALIADRNFDQESKEIRFFKHMKPRILAKLLYYIYVRKLEEVTSLIDDKCRRKYYRKKLKRIGKFQRKNADFIKYYKSEKTHMDNLFFTRLHPDDASPDEPELLLYDASFCTSHDYKAAKVIAKEELARYIATKLNFISSPVAQQTPAHTKVPLKWTGSKIGLAELIYAIDAMGAVNNGDADLVDIAEVFAKGFNIDFGDDFYHKRAEIKARKLDRTRFLNELIRSLNSSLDGDDKN